MLLPITRTAGWDSSVVAFTGSLSEALLNAATAPVEKSADRTKERNFMSALLRLILNRLIQRLKGRSYVIDERIDALTLARVVSDRVFGLLRGSIARLTLKSGSSWFVFVGPRVQIKNAKFIRLGRGTTIGAGTILNGLSRSGVLVGDNVAIGQYVIVEATGVLTDLGAGLSIGAGSGLGAFSFVGAAGGIDIGENVIMGQRISFHSENHNFASADTDIRYQGVTRQGIRIGNNCWVGANVTFLDGTEVGSGCVIAAGSILKGYFPDNSLIAGVPAQVKRSRLNQT